MNWTTLISPKRGRLLPTDFLVPFTLLFYNRINIYVLLNIKFTLKKVVSVKNEKARNFLEFCYFLNSQNSGKSVFAVHAQEALRKIAG